MLPTCSYPNFLRFQIRSFERHAEELQRDHTHMRRRLTCSGTQPAFSVSLLASLLTLLLLGPHRRVPGRLDSRCTPSSAAEYCLSQSHPATPVPTKKAPIRSSDAAPPA